MENQEKSYDSFAKHSESNEQENDFSIRNKNKNQSNIGHSGNSDVDVNVNVEIDTTAIAYAILCSSLAKKELTNEEFELAVKKLEELISEKQRKKPNYQRNGQKDRLFRIW